MIPSCVEFIMEIVGTDWLFPQHASGFILSANGLLTVPFPLCCPVDIIFTLRSVHGEFITRDLILELVAVALLIIS